MDGDRIRKPRPTATANGRGSTRTSTFLIALVVIVLGAGFVFVVSNIPSSDDREASGWMYKAVALVPGACPPLAAEVKAIAAQPVMTVGDAKRIAGRLEATADASSIAWERHNGRIMMHMPVGREPLECSKYDPNYEGSEIELLPDYAFRVSDRAGDGS